MMRGTVPIALAVLVVLAGCAAPVADPPGSSSPKAVGTESTVAHADVGGTPVTDRDDAAVDGEETADPEYDGPSTTGLEVRGGDLPFEENRTFERVQDLLEVELRSPVVYVEEPLSTPRGVERNPSSFYAVMNVSLPDPDDAGDELGVGGAASPMNAVYVMPDDEADPEEIERVLVHELVHAAQFQERIPQAFEAAVPTAHRGTTDADLTYVSVMEAGAVYGSSAYTAAADVDVDPEGAVLERRYPEAAPGTRLVWGPYYYGYQYVDDRYDSAAAHWEMYDDPPVTMQGVMTGAPGSETDLEPFDARLAAGDTEWSLTEADTKGAFVAKLVLGTELETSESRAVVSGWEYDRLLRADHEGEDGDGYAWSLRFDRPDDAEAFEAAAVDYLEARATDTEVDGESIDGDVSTEVAPAVTWHAEDNAYALSSVDDRTVTILAGSEAFVEAATVEPAGSSDVRVVVDSDREDAPAIDDRAETTVTGQVSETTP